jgi:hypothetical protein
MHAGGEIDTAPELAKSFLSLTPGITYKKTISDEIIKEWEVNASYSVSTYPKDDLIFKQSGGWGFYLNGGINTRLGGLTLSYWNGHQFYTPQGGRPFQNYPGTDMVFGYVEQFISPELTDEHKSNLIPELEKMQGFLAGAMLIKKTTFLKVGFFNEKLELGEFIDWFSRAKDLGLTYEVLPEILLRRRIHDANMGIYKKHFKKDYTSILREAIARKRKANE